MWTQVAAILVLVGVAGPADEGRAHPSPRLTDVGFASFESEQSQTKQDRAEPRCNAPCVWERQYGDGGNFIAGDLAYLLADARALPDGGAVITGTRAEGGERDVWLTRLDEAGAEIWEAVTPGFACAAASAGDGSAVLAKNAVPGDTFGVLGINASGERTFVIGLSFEPFNIDAGGAGGFLVSGWLGRESIVVAFDETGERRWTWLGGTTDGVALSATVHGDGTVYVLGRGPDEDGANDQIWLAALDSESGTQTSLTKIHITNAGSMRGCDGVQVMGSIDPLGGDGLLIRYAAVDQSVGFMRTTIASIGLDGRMRWLRETPFPADRAPPSTSGDFSEDDVTAASATPDGGALIAGFTHRPLGAGSPYVARLNETGTEIWRTELPLVPPGTPAQPPIFATVDEMPDDGVIAAVTDGLLLMRLSAFVFRLAPHGTQ